MAENLNYVVESSWCYENSADSCAKYGRLYQWASAMNIDPIYNSTSWGGSDVNHQGICPDGWHISSMTNWCQLNDYVEQITGGEEVGTSLKATNGWTEGSNGNDNFGFSALPAGFALDNSYFALASANARFWSASEMMEDQVEAWGLYQDGSFHTESVNGNKFYGFSIRCIKG
jgi:uncharacterized protein (TIGR02145 family)